jgi:YD repeat-containing protein
MSTGEVVRLDLERSSRPAAAASSAAARPGAAHGAAVPSRSIRKPAWTLPVVSTEDQAESAVVTVLNDPPRIGLFSSAGRNRLQVLTTEGKNLGHAPEVLGIGRILRTAPGWIAAATDRQVALYDARRNLATRLDVSLVEITHLVIQPDSYGIAIVQERDRVGRVTLSGRWVWKAELRSPVEDLAIGPDGHAALTREDGRLEIYDPAGTIVGDFSVNPVEPLCLVEAPSSSADLVTWVSLARRTQVLRGHDLSGRVVWETAVPWEGWHLQRVGPLALVNAPDGRALAYDGAGRLRGQARATGGGPEVFGATAQGEPWRVVHQGVHLICSDFDGRVRWRAVADEPLGPFACGTPGVAVLIGRALAWFGAEAAGEG